MAKFRRRITNFVLWIFFLFSLFYYYSNYSNKELRTNSTEILAKRSNSKGPLPTEQQEIIESEFPEIQLDKRKHAKSADHQHELEHSALITLDDLEAVAQSIKHQQEPEESGSKTLETEMLAQTIRHQQELEESGDKTQETEVLAQSITNQQELEESGNKTLETEVLAQSTNHRQEIEQSDYKNWGLQTDKETSKQVKRVVVLVASLPRSGSTLLAELLRTKKNTVLFFEPDHRVEHTPCADIGNCMSDYVRDILSCAFTGEYEYWQRRHFFSYFHQKAKDCGTDMICKKAIDIRAMCREADFALTKVIRVPLGFFEPLLSDSSIDARIIHLIRDPRASIKSNRVMKWNWDPFQKCTKIDNDLQDFQHLHSLFPSKTMQIRYEDFCLDALGVTKSLFRFAYGDEKEQKLSDETLNYLKTHTESTETKTKKGWGMNTIRDSKKFYQAWRWKIGFKLLDAIEKEPVCESVLKKLNLKIMRNRSNLLNKKISLFVPPNS